ncbi:MAG: tRNA (guanosine(46)-N7)-methyltransferase TrmB [Magnetococcales bacterium]|nr:tRNA (guanosine(46)-N7)-methyltransferase TrmB [Magnetococcales bacterium]
MTITLTPDERRRYKTHGRKKGFLKPKDETHLKECLPALTLTGGVDRQQLLSAFGGVTESTRLWLEIGFGNGDFLAHLAALHPEDRFVGIDVFLEGVSALLRRLERQGSDNVRVVVDNANVVLMERIPPDSLDRVVINFPDPWRKKRHHKRRLIQPPFLDLLAERMRRDGLLSLATDWGEYSDWMLEHLQAHPAFENCMDGGGFAPQPDEWIETRFQSKGQKAGRPARHLLFRKVEG